MGKSENYGRKLEHTFFVCFKQLLTRRLQTAAQFEPLKTEHIFQRVQGLYNKLFLS